MVSLSHANSFACTTILMLFLRLDAHLDLHGSRIVHLCVAYVQNTSERALCFHKWTLDPLGTRWRPANPAHIVYPSLYTKTGMVDHVYSLFCAAWRPERWHLRETVCLVCSGILQVPESFSSRSISCLLLGSSLNLWLSANHLITSYLTHIFHNSECISPPELHAFFF